MAVGRVFEEKFIKEFGGYFFCNLVALLADLGLFSLLVRITGMNWALAVCIGFVVGAALSYALSVLWVFSERKMAKNGAGVEFLIFLLIGVCGLGCCEATVWVGVHYSNFPIEVIRGLAAGVTFCLNFVLRKIVLF